MGAVLHPNRWGGVPVTHAAARALVARPVAVVRAPPPAWAIFVLTLLGCALILALMVEAIQRGLL